MIGDKKDLTERIGRVLKTHGIPHDGTYEDMYAAFSLRLRPEIEYEYLVVRTTKAACGIEPIQGYGKHADPFVLLRVLEKYK